jgi:demethylmenaquinone methyltransferase / 2-methoxy-6-polyprenyl-1,4-benzoquinol methylase
MQQDKKKRYRPVTEVSEAERIGMVKEIFSTVTGKYDFLNHFLSLRRDISWRRFAVKKMRFFKTHRLLDVATGTGDLTIDALRTHPSIRVIGLDFVGEMMDLARLKVEKEKISDRVFFLRGDALALPFPDQSFDAAGIAFGIRNIPNRLKALKEMARIIVPGGRVLVLEMATPRSQPLKGIYQFFLSRILPGLARPFSRNPAAYHYLADSIIHFPAPDLFAEEMKEAGLTRIEIYSLDLGITYLHIGYKPETR